MTRLLRLLVFAAVVFMTLPGSYVAALSEPGGVTEDEKKLQALDGEITSIAERIPQVEKMLKTARGQKAETAKQLAEVRREVQDLRPELERRTADYGRKRKLLIDSISADYRSHRPDSVEMLATSGSVSGALAKMKYTAVVEEHLDRLSRDAREAFDELHDRTTTLEGKQSTLEVLERQLEAWNASIEAQHAELQELLANRSQEANYLQKKIARAQEVQAQLLDGGSALWGSFKDGERVKRGQTIGFEGSTGFSTGCHTHFSVIKNGRWNDPDAFWSMLRHPDGSVVQPYGWTAWAKQGVYGGNIHNGIDLVQGCGKPVKAAAGGVVVRETRDDGSGFGHYIMIRHSGGLMTLYAHLI